MKTQNLAMLGVLVIGLVIVDTQPLAESPADSPEDGFELLFNGRDLSGWTGDTTGYQVVDGILVANPEGNLYTEREFADFVFRFEFKLTAGANNGIGIRVPPDGKASRDGLEIQILDDSFEGFAAAQPWQRHGSVYGIVPAHTGYLKAVGEWNEEEIRVQGMRVRVTLNGTVIVDADLTPFRDGAPTPDGKDHPGLKRSTGRLSLAGHRTQLYLQNFRIKPL